MERTYFFDSTENDERIYQAADFARFHAQIIGNGVSNTANLPDLEVNAQQNMNVGLGAGYMSANGYMYENTETMVLTHDVADSINNRIDRVVIRFDNNPEQRRIYATIKKGTPSSNPVTPTLTRDSYIYEMSVAQVRIIAGKSFIEQTEVKDERANDSVCGYIPLHNIYRGLEVDELGRLSFPKQTHVTSYANVKQSVSKTPTGSVADALVLLPNILKDTQNEYISSRSIFKSKSEGTILVNVQLDLKYFKSEYIITVLVYKNNEMFQEIGYASGGGINANTVGINGTSLIPVSVGDELDIRLYTNEDVEVRGRGSSYCRVDYFKIA